MHMYMYGTEFMHMQKCKSSSHYVPAKLGGYGCGEQERHSPAELMAPIYTIQFWLQ